jgi:hypothetical protein
MSAFTAQYHGPCAAGDRIEPGDQVVYVNDELVHLDCEREALTQLDRDAKKRVCTVCFLVEGSCDCEDGGTY